MFAEKKPAEGWRDIKQNRGGIVDIEFLVQFLMLAFAAQHPDIVRRNTANALRGCQQAGLLSAEEYAVLEEAYGFLRLLENRLRLLHGKSENRVSPNPAVREQLRRLCDLPEGTDIVQRLDGHFQAVYAIVREYLEGSRPLLPSPSSSLGVG
ncbi:MAG: hypothetical protein H7835_17345 [Magnetococcus sp. XQGC-1]